MDRGITDILHSVKEEQKSRVSATPLAQFVALEGETEFPIYSESLTIGRVDPVTKITPEIDLTEIDEMRSVSRRHARLHMAGGQFLVTEEVGVSNGTFVNGQRLEPGKPLTVTDGDKVKFGNVELQFSTASSE